MLDTTCGLGRDTMHLAARGIEVVALERNRVMFELLSDALLRARADDLLAPIVARIRLQCADAHDWLSHCADDNRPDAIIIDPMFHDPSSKSAVKRESAILRALVPNDTDAIALVEPAIRVARHRVAVKRSRRGNALWGAPDMSINGRSVRFDVYLRSSTPT